MDSEQYKMLLERQHELWLKLHTVQGWLLAIVVLIPTCAFGAACIVISAIKNP